MAAYVLAHAGLSVALVEAGPHFDPAIHSLQLKNPWESPRRGAGTVRLHRLMTVTTSLIRRELGDLTPALQAEVDARLRKLFDL